jgi:hypothetical protein
MSAQTAHFSRSARSGWRLRLISVLLVERLMVRCAWGPQASDKLLWSCSPACWLCIVYNCRDDPELEGSTLIGTGPDVYTKKVGGLLVLIALLATVSYLTGCGGAGGLGEGTLVTVMFAGLGLLFSGSLIYRLAQRRKKKPVERGG